VADLYKRFNGDMNAIAIAYTLALVALAST
jgi:hypothetical protein